MWRGVILGLWLAVNLWVVVDYFYFRHRITVVAVTLAQEIDSLKGQLNEAKNPTTSAE